MFCFFLQSYKTGILTFGGEGVEVIFDINGPDGKETMKNFENGLYRNSPIITRHSNIVKSIIIGKKSWGLHIKMWSEGIRDWCFTQEEILEDFKINKINIPESLKMDFENWIFKYKKQRYISL